MYRSSAFFALDCIQIVMSASSAVLAVWAARRGVVNTRPLHASIAALSVVYCCGYLVLVIVQPPVRDWSNVMRGVGLVTWPLAWMSWSIISVRLQGRVGKLRAVVDERTHHLEDAA